MRAIALSIIVFSGAFMAVGGAIAEAMPSSQRVCYADEFGLVIAVVGVFMLILEIMATASRESQNKAKP
ncbi:hypothetical protein [Botrimarina mediterranea]|uniref:hypothetical protein n=1 Tax=Botrimarina mediterranea TaxID=2528022 RepID=UPI00118ADFD2|nr:hypothetical protein K2D_36560 [Planctomycetes bacterium K2D]